MAMCYKKLFRLMEEKGIKKVDLRRSGMSASTIDRLIKNSDVTTSTISRLCGYLACQPGDIMEYIKPGTEVI